MTNPSSNPLAGKTVLIVTSGDRDHSGFVERSLKAGGATVSFSSHPPHKHYETSDFAKELASLSPDAVLIFHPNLQIPNAVSNCIAFTQACMAFTKKPESAAQEAEPSPIPVIVQDAYMEHATRAELNDLGATCLSNNAGYAVITKAIADALSPRNGREAPCRC